MCLTEQTKKNPTTGTVGKFGTVIDKAYKYFCIGFSYYLSVHIQLIGATNYVLKLFLFSLEIDLTTLEASTKE